jgi:hypothetical protein
VSPPNAARRSRDRVVCVLGMHRSGTSLIARMVNLLGVYFGPEERMLPPQPDNPKGFWEYRPFVLLNERILDRYGGSWDAPPAFPDRWWRSPRALDLRFRARALAYRDFRSAPVWGWKDPRTCLALPFWRSLYPQMIAIVCVRNPIDVARSLERREDIPIDRGLRLWEQHLAAALEHSEGSPRLVVAYEDALRAPLDVAERLGRLIGPGGDMPALTAAAQLEDVVDPGSQHHATPAADVLSNAAIPVSVRALYARVSQMADPALGDPVRV